MTPLDRSRTWRHELALWAVAVAGGAMLAGWAVCALAILVKVGP